MIITDIRTRTMSGDIILMGFCRGVRVDGHETSLTIAEPTILRDYKPEELDPAATIKTFTAEIHRYVGRPGGYLLVQATDPVEWIPGWRPVT